METIKNIFYGVCSLAIMLLYLAIMLLYLAVCCMMAVFLVLVGFWLWGKIL